jgi:hypothetical protein
MRTYKRLISKPVYIGLGVLIFVVIVGLFLYVQLQSSIVIGGASKFEGRIASVSNQCMSDGFCSVTVGDREIITGCGWAFDDSMCPKQEDTYLGLQEGDRVRVKALKLSDGRYSLHCGSCSLKKL